MMRLIVGFYILLSCTTVKAQTDSVSQKTGLPGPTIFTFVEQMPEFTGGESALIKFLKENVQYPQMERDNDIQGKVLVRFVVMEDGKVDDVKVIRGVSPGLDAEAVRVLKKLPDFKPGKQQGKAVRVYYNIPIVFKLEDNTPKEDALMKAKFQKDENFRNAVAQIKLNNFKEAAKDLKKSIKNYPDDYFSYDLIAEVDQKLGHSKDACKDWQIALKKGSPTANDYLKTNCK